MRTWGWRRVRRISSTASAGTPRFAYLDPVRERSNLTIVGDSPCERLEISSGRVNAVVVAGREGPVRLEVGRVIVAAGTYGSPAILERSGIGDPSELRSAGIAPMHDLPGVGHNLHDHPRVTLSYAGTRELEEMMAAFARDHWMPEEQTIAKARSSRCTQAFDLHVYPVGGPDRTTPTGWRWTLEVACMTPRSRGALRLTNASSAVPPILDHRYLSDPEDEDLRVLADGVALAREIAAKPALSRLAGESFHPAAPSRPAPRSRRSSGPTACTTTIRWGRAGWARRAIGPRSSIRAEEFTASTTLTSLTRRSFP